MRRTVPPSAEIEARIEQLFSVGVGEDPSERLWSSRGSGARLIFQRAVGRVRRLAWARPLRAPARRERGQPRGGDWPAQRVSCAAGPDRRGGARDRNPAGPPGRGDVRVQAVPADPEVVGTEPLKALVIGAFVRGLSMRDVESLCEQAGLGSLSKSTASRMCEELKDRFEAFRRRDLYEIRLVALFLDATFIAVRPDGPKEGVQVAWGFTDDGERVLLAVSLGMRESFEDWQTLGRDLISRGLGGADLIVADGAPG